MSNISAARTIVRTDKINRPSIKIYCAWLDDKRLSLNAKGILLCLIRTPGSCVADLATHKTNGRDSTASGMAELLKFGYCRREQERVNGRFAGYSYTVNQLPRVAPKAQGKRYLLMDIAGIDDERLSHNATGLLAILLSRPDDWQFYVSEISRHSATGEIGTAAAMKELLRHGYCRRHRYRDVRGRFSRYSYTVYEVPVFSDPLPFQESRKRDVCSVPPSTDIPLLEVSSTLTQGLPKVRTNIKVQSTNQSIIPHINNLDRTVGAEKEIKKRMPLQFPPEKASPTVPCGTTLGDIIAQNISYYHSRESYQAYDRLMLDNIYRLLVDVVSSKRKWERIGGQNVPAGH